jgi:hypothetical protein
MEKTRNEPGRRTAGAHYTQVKVSVDTEVAGAFKAACGAAGVSMAAVLSDFMEKYAGMKRTQPSLPPTDTRRKRRKELETLILRLERLSEAETESMENTPENLRGSERYEDAERIVSELEDAAEALREVYA